MLEGTPTGPFSPSLPLPPNRSVQKERLTQRQNEAYEFIRSYLFRHQKPPTLEEIGDGLDIASTNAVYKLLRALETKGWIDREKHEARSIQLTDEEPGQMGERARSPSLPIVSRTPSEAPERLWERPKGTLSVDARLLRRARDPDSCLVGHAGDDGMAEVGIHKGDLLLIEEVNRTEMETDMQVAVLRQRQLLARTVQFVNDKIHLHAPSRHYTDETFHSEDGDCYLIGPVLGLIRTL